MAGEVTEYQSYEQSTANDSSNYDEFDAFSQQRQVPTFQRPVEPRGGGEFAGRILTFKNSLGRIFVFSLAKIQLFHDGPSAIPTMK